MPQRKIVSLPCASVIPDGARVAFGAGVAVVAGPGDYSIGTNFGRTNGRMNATVELDREWTERRAVARFPAGTQLVENAAGVQPGNIGNGPAALFALMPGPDASLMVAIGRIVGSSTPPAPVAPSAPVAVAPPAPKAVAPAASTFVASVPQAPPPTKGPMATQTSTRPAATELDRRVNALTTADPKMSRATATLDVFRADEPLRQRWLAEQNAKPVAGPAQTPTAIAQWDAAVKVKTDAGRTVPQAIRELSAEQPALHQSYLAAYTEQARARASTRRG